ncbi:metal-sulfur cluster assembly factor [Micrococcales bacterium 31B]|nr:metal-sulfur cluster assembly factor [Micrococcales bacterium 31B]
MSKLLDENEAADNAAASAEANAATAADTAVDAATETDSAGAVAALTEAEAARVAAATAGDFDDLDEDAVLEAMKDVIDPELGINVVDLGLVYGVTVDGGDVVLDMTLTSAACPLTDVIEEQTFSAVDPLCRTHRINWVWMPPWGMEKITEDGRDQLRAIGFNI